MYQKMKKWVLVGVLVSVGVSFSAALDVARISVSPAETKQKIVGFGGGSVYYQNWITALGEETKQALFDTAFTGLNLSLLRVGNWLQDESADLSNDVAIVTAGKKRLGSQMKILMSSWSAPATLKPSGSVNGKDAGDDKSKASLKKASNDLYGDYAYGDFAHWWKASLLKYQAAGISPDYISFQNEPDMFAEYEETLFDPEENTEKAGYAQALNAIYDSISTLKNAPVIVGPEPLGIGYNNFQNYMAKLNNDKLGGYAYHLYHAGSGNDNSASNYSNPENFRAPMKAIGTSYGSDAKPIIMTEFCSMEENGKEEYMTGLAHIMQVGFSDGKLNGFIAWELLWGEGKGQLIGVCTKGWGKCTEDAITISPEYHALRHYSKFVSPGWRVINSTVDNGDNLYAVAFRAADCDSIVVVVTNEGASTTLSAPEVSGYKSIDAVQSVEKGEKSKTISVVGTYTIPANSVTTFVYKAESLSGLTCEDSPIIDPYVEPDLGDSIVIVDYGTTTDVSNWNSDESLNAVSYGTLEIDGISGYATVPLAGCDQNDCGYQHAIFSLPTEVGAALQKCSDLVVTMHSRTDTTAYVNIGGAGGTSWTNYKYGVPGGASSWVTTTISLASETDSAGTLLGSNKLTFNSDGNGVLISKILATGCGSSAIPSISRGALSSLNSTSRIYDLRGRLVWTGKLSEVEISGRVLKIQNMKAGVYFVRTQSGTFSAIKR